MTYDTDCANARAADRMSVDPLSPLCLDPADTEYRATVEAVDRVAGRVIGNARKRAARDRKIAQDPRWERMWAIVGWTLAIVGSALCWWALWRVAHP